MNTNYLNRLPDEVTVQFTYESGCLPYYHLVNKLAYFQSQYYVTLLFRNIMKHFGSDNSLQVEFKEGKVFIDGKEFGTIASLRLSHLTRVADIIREKFISQGFPWEIQTIVHHSQLVEAQNEAKKSLEELPLVWPKMREALAENNNLPIDIPHENASIKGICAFLLNPKNAVYLNKVKVLSFFDLGLKVSPFGINLFKNLEKLNFSYNQFEKVPYLDLLNLYEVFFGTNQISTFPNQIFKGCPSLSSLDLMRNRISVVDTNLCDYPGLKILHLDDLVDISKFKCCSHLKINRPMFQDIQWSYQSKINRVRDTEWSFMPKETFKMSKPATDRDKRIRREYIETIMAPKYIKAIMPPKAMKAIMPPT